MKKLWLCLLIGIGGFQLATAQEALEIYVDSALVHNMVMQKKNIALNRAEYALKAAKSMFYPSLHVKADYTSANGGRDIELPLGDLLNGAYATLNELTQSDRFPQLENQRVNFLPHNFYDAKVRASVPIFNGEMIYNKRIKDQQVELNADQIAIYKRELIKDVKTAYYAYLQAAESIKIYQSSLDLAKEGKRVNERLLEHGKGVPAYVLRAKSEIEKVHAKLTEAREKADNAKRHFNFLLNRDQEATIDTTGASVQAEQKIIKALHRKVDVSGREELESLTAMIELKTNVQKLKKSAFYPSLNGFVDVGSQAEDWKFNDQSRYVMVGLKLDIPLFEGNRNRYKLKRAELEVKDARLDLKRVKQQMRLRSHNVKNKLHSTYQNYLSAKKQLKAAKSYHRLIMRGYKAGTNSYIETLDARNQLTEGRIAVSISRYKMLGALAELERETASYSIK